MKGAVKILLLFAMCLAFVPREIAGQELKGKDLIEKVCQKAPMKDLCVLVLGSDKTSTGANIQDLAMISLKAASGNAKQIIDHVKMLIDDDQLDADIQQGLADCQDTLNDAEDQLEDAVAAVLVNVNADAQKWLQAALAAVDTCEASLKGNDNVLLGKEEEFRHYCNIALAVCSQIHA